jgi:hypothetical protein
MMDTKHDKGVFFVMMLLSIGTIVTGLEFFQVHQRLEAVERMARATLYMEMHWR